MADGTRILSDAALRRLRRAADTPEISGTRYGILEEIGRGGMGTVYRASDAVLGRDVALKVLTLSEADPADADRLRQEARVVALLEHPGIVPVHDAGVLPDGRVYYAMKLVRGEPLDREGPPRQPCRTGCASFRRSAMPWLSLTRMA